MRLHHTASRLQVPFATETGREASDAAATVCFSVFLGRIKTRWAFPSVFFFRILYNMCASCVCCYRDAQLALVLPCHLEGEESKKRQTTKFSLVQPVLVSIAGSFPNTQCKMARPKCYMLSVFVPPTYTIRNRLQHRVAYESNRTPH